MARSITTWAAGLSRAGRQHSFAASANAAADGGRRVFMGAGPIGAECAHRGVFERDHVPFVADDSPGPVRGAVVNRDRRAAVGDDP